MWLYTAMIVQYRCTPTDEPCCHLPVSTEKWALTKQSVTAAHFAFWSFVSTLETSRRQVSMRRVLAVLTVQSNMLLKVSSLPGSIALTKKNKSDTPTHRHRERDTHTQMIHLYLHVEDLWSYTLYPTHKPCTGHEPLPDSRRYANVWAMQSRSSSGSRAWGGLLSSADAAEEGAGSSWKAATGRGCMTCSDTFTARSPSDSLWNFSSASKGWDLKGGKNTSIRFTLASTKLHHTAAVLTHYTTTCCVAQADSKLNCKLLYYTISTDHGNYIWVGMHGVVQLNAPPGSPDSENNW